MSLPPLKQVVTADTSQFDRAMGRLPNIAARVGRAIVVGFTAAATAMAALTVRSLQNIDAMTKQSRSLGLTTRAFQAMTLVANEAGVSSDRLAASLGLMQRQIIELDRGSKTAVDAFNRLGLSIENLQGLEPDEQFRRIAERLNDIEDPATRTATAMEVFGRSGRDVINMLDGYSDKVAEAADFQEKFGIAVSQTDAEAIERANDAVGRLREAFSGLGNVLAARFAPLMERAAKAATDLAVGFANKLKPATDDLALTIIDANKHFPTMESGLNRVGAAGDEAARGMSAAQVAAKELIDEIIRARELGLADVLGLQGQTTQGPGPVSLPGAFRTPGQTGGISDLGIEGFLADPDRDMVQIPAPSPFAPSRSIVPPGRGVDDFPAVPSLGGGGAVRNQLAERLEALQEGLATEDELIAQWYQDGLQTLNDALASRQLTEEEYMALRERLEKEHQERLNAIRGAGESIGLENTKSVLGSMLQAVQAGGDKMIGAQKAISAAIAAINVYQGITKALSTQNWGLALQTAAYGFAQVAKIQSIGKGSVGGGASSAASGGAGAAQALPRQNIIIDLVGDTFSRGSVQELFNQLNDGLRSGYQIEGVLVR
jgi:hypothetical protein